MEHKYSWKWIGIGLVTGACLSIFLARYFFTKQTTKKLSLRKLVQSSRCDSLEMIPTENHRLVDQRFPFVVKLALARSKKKPNSATKTDPFLYPFEPGIFLTTVGDYYLLFNKYPVVPQHVLLVTKEFQAQTDPLTAVDFEAAQRVMKELKGLVFYNSGETSGYSQPHKHIQIIPINKLSELPLDSVLKPFSTLDSFTLPQFQFRHRIQKLQVAITPSDLHSVYHKLFRELRSSPKSSYNLLMTQDWMFIVLREQDKAFGKFSFNALAFAGLMLVNQPEDLEYLRKIGPLNALRDISVKL